MKRNWMRVYQSLLVTVLTVTRLAAAAAPGASASTPAAAAVGGGRNHPLERRVEMLTRELGLDSMQSQRLRLVLTVQRRQMLQLWNDGSLPPAGRVAAAHTVSDRTGNEIRALLTEEQRRRYNAPRRRPATAPGPRGPSVEDWMMAAAAGSRPPGGGR